MNILKIILLMMKWILLISGDIAKGKRKRKSKKEAEEEILISIGKKKVKE